MFVNNATGQRGLVCQYDVVCFDEVSASPSTRRTASTS
jgi:predicted ATP-dependent Lon-type protease